MEHETIKQRSTAREQACIVAGLIVEEAGRIPTEAQGAFWDELQKMVPFPKPEHQPAPGGEPFTDRQSAAFGRSKMPFGKFAGNAIDEINLEYLQKLCDPSPFIHSLRRYLASPRIQSEAKE